MSAPKAPTAQDPMPKLDSVIGIQEYARELFWKRQKVQAVHHLKTGLEKFPQNTALLNQLASVHLDISEPREALTYYQRCITIDPRNIEARIGEARSLAKIGNLSSADASLSALNQATPNNPDVLSAWATVCNMNHDFGHAEELFSAVLKLTNNDAHILYKLGVTHALHYTSLLRERSPNQEPTALMKDKLACAQHTFEQAHEADYQNTNTLHALAKIYALRASLPREQDAFDLAVRTLRKSMDLTSHLPVPDHTPHEILALLYLSHQRYQDLDRVIRQAPKYNMTKDYCGILKITAKGSFLRHKQGHEQRLRALTTSRQAMEDDVKMKRRNPDATMARIYLTCTMSANDPYIETLRDLYNNPGSPNHFQTLLEQARQLKIKPEAITTMDDKFYVPLAFVIEAKPAQRSFRTTARQQPRTSLTA